MKLLYDEHGNDLTHRRDIRTARAEIVYVYEEEPVRQLVGAFINDLKLGRTFNIFGKPDAKKRYFEWLEKEADA